MKKWILFPVVFLLSCIIGLYLLVATETGLHLLLKITDRIAGKYVTVEKVEGSLISALSLSGLRIDLPAMMVSVESLSYSWNPSHLLTASLDVESLSVEGVVLDFKETSGRKIKRTRPCRYRQLFCQCVFLLRILWLHLSRSGVRVKRYTR